MLVIGVGSFFVEEEKKRRSDVDVYLDGLKIIRVNPVFFLA